MQIIFAPFVSMAELERDLDVIFDVIPTSENLPSKLTAEKVYATVCVTEQICIKVYLYLSFYCYVWA